MPYDAPSRALAAMLHAASPEERYFDLSEPGTITVRTTAARDSRRRRPAPPLSDRQAGSEGARAAGVRAAGQRRSRRRVPGVAASRQRRRRRRAHADRSRAGGGHGARADRPSDRSARRMTSTPRCGRFSPGRAPSVTTAGCSSGGLNVEEIDVPGVARSAARGLGEDPAAPSRRRHAAGRCAAAAEGAARRDDRRTSSAPSIARMPRSRRIPGASPRSDSIATSTPTRSATCSACGSARRSTSRQTTRATASTTSAMCSPCRPLLTERYLAAAERIASMGDLHRDSAEADRGRLSRPRPEDSPRRSQHHRSRTPRRVRRRLYGPHRPSG